MIRKSVQHFGYSV